MKKDKDSEIFKRFNPSKYYEILEWKDNNMQEFNSITEGRALCNCSMETIHRIIKQMEQDEL